MKRFAILTTLFSSVLVLAMPARAFAANATFFGPLIPDACNCPGQAAGFGCVMQVVQNAINMGISLACIIATLALVYGGFMFMASAANPENRSAGMKMIMSAFFGLVIVLSAWLIVDYIMKVFYNGGGQFGPWNTILADPSASQCIVATVPSKLFDGNIIGATPGSPSTYGNGSGAGAGTGAGAGNGSGYTGTGFTYQPGIEAQKSTASGALAGMLTCMAGKVNAGVGQISSISDSKIISGEKTFQQCDSGGQGAGCAHHQNSCHYGGPSCVGSSYAVDFGDEQNADALKTAALACGATYTGFEGNHLHVSIGKSCGCN